jgi:hypothetical protein
MQVGGPTKAKGVDEVFGRGTSAAVATPTSAINRDGSLDACRKSQSEGEKPQENCAAPLRLELKPLLEGPVAPAESANDAEIANPTCSMGFAPTDDGKCVKTTSKLPRFCDYKDPDDCAIQCERGSMGSCAVLGRNYQMGRGVPQDPKKAADLLVRACKGGAAAACSRTAEMLLAAPARRQEGLQLLLKSCSMGWAEACTVARAHSANWHQTLHHGRPDGRLDLEGQPKRSIGR